MELKAENKPTLSAELLRSLWEEVMLSHRRRGSPSALIRLARRLPNPKSDQHEHASHLLSRTKEGTLKEVQKQTHLTDSEEKAKLASRSFAYERRPRSRFRPRLP
jgi:hypothetical protein